MSRRRRPPVLASLLLGMTLGIGVMTPTAGDMPTYQITLDPARTEVSFSLGALFHTVQGRGVPRAATLDFAPEEGLLTGSVILAAAGLTTENESRDKKMQEEVLKSPIHPDIVLELKRAEGPFDPETGGDLQVEASLHLLGKSHPVSFPLEVTILMDEEGGFRAKGAFMVPYVAWGLKDPSKVFLRVDKEVQVSFSTAGTMRVTPPPPGP